MAIMESPSQAGNDQRISNVVIVGGGTAGWMCAAALSRLIPHAGVSITLIESDEIGTVGVGEATIPTLLAFNQLLGLNEDEFIRETQGTFKLGIEFVDWRELGHRYIHPFGTFGLDMQAVKFHQFWLRLARSAHAADIGELGDYNLCTAAAKLQRFTRPAGGPNSVLSSLRYAFHFDAGLYAKYLRRYSEERGVKRIEGTIDRVDLDRQSGFIRTLRLRDDRRITGQLFIDCSGFRSVLMQKALGIWFESWSRWLHCDRAVAIPCKSSGPLLPYTRSTADRAGWRWRIPLQHRTGNGYVYSSKFLDDERATARLISTLDGEPLSQPRMLRFTPGRCKKFWERNCVAIGLAGGFIEPLESTSIHLIQTGIARLLALFPDRRFSQPEIDEYNRATALEYEQVRDFIILHYKANQREDTVFWRECREMKIPDSLEQKIALFRSKGRVLRRQEDLFTDDSWIAVMLGQGIEPQGHDPLVDSLPLDNAQRFVSHVRELVAKTAQAMPSHGQFISKHCAAGEG